MDQGQRGPARGQHRPKLTLADLIRWEEHGAGWRMVADEDDHVVVALCTCHGEPVDLLRGDQPELIEFVRARRGN
jgi:hypothetical protein